MEQQITCLKSNKPLLIITGITGINGIILIHELGHFLCALYFGVPTPVFSLGFGPALIHIPVGNTIFQIAALPFGGYVELNETILATQPYLPKMIIMLAGVAFNFIFSYTILSYFSARKTTYKSSLKECIDYIRQKYSNQGAFIGPIGLIKIIGESFQTNIHFFWLILALISLNVGIFNLLPIPFLDGGKALLYTIEAITGSSIAQNYLSVISFVFFTAFALAMSVISLNDLKQFKQN